MKESELQTQIKNRLTKHGWLVVKLISTNWNGIPDLLCMRKGVAMMLEVKTDNGVLAPAGIEIFVDQKYIHII